MVLLSFSQIRSNVNQTIRYLTDLGYMPFDWSTLRFSIDVQKDLPQHHIPEGFRIRPLNGRLEVDAYVQLHREVFNSDNMTQSWRLRTLEHPAYVPELDLVICTSGDIPVGFCVGWIWQGRGQIEPLGVHPEYHGMGLGTALELAALHALKNHGARSVVIDHVSLNEKALSLSMRTGFKPTNNILRYYLDVNPEY